MAGLRLDSRERCWRGELGPVVSPKEPEQSLLLQAIRFEELEMPPSGKLPPSEVEVLTRWVKDGIPWSPGPLLTSKSGVATARPAAVLARTTVAARREWSHRPVVRPSVPTVKRPEWCRNPIDAFLLWLDSRHKG